MPVDGGDPPRALPVPVRGRPPGGSTDQERPARPGTRRDWRGGHLGGQLGGSQRRRPASESCTLNPALVQVPWRGERVVHVFWSPAAGFKLQIVTFPSPSQFPHLEKKQVIVVLSSYSC